MFEDKDDEQSIKQLERLEQLYGNVNFDSVIIIDFGSSLKSVLTSLVYTDVSEKDVLFTTLTNGLMKLFLRKHNKKYLLSINKL